MGKKPIVGIITNEIIGFNGRQASHSTGKRYVDAVMNFSDVLPILIPTCVKQDQITEILDNQKFQFPQKIY